MTKRKVMSIILAAVCAVLALSGGAASPKPDDLKIAGEMLRNLLLAFVIRWLLASQRAITLRAALSLAAILWLGFPFTLLSGSVMWQNVPLELGVIHCGDWLIKILVITLTLWLVNRNAEMRFHLAAVRVVQPN